MRRPPTDRMALAPGTRLGAYDIVALIGSGGMGEVYRARDSRLNRDVAIKVLPSDVAADHDRLARFEREAQVLVSLNHPNIAQIHGVEESPACWARAIWPHNPCRESVQERVVRQIRMLRAMRRGLETDSRWRLHGHAGGNSGHGQGATYGFPRQFPTLPRPRPRRRSVFTRSPVQRPATQVRGPPAGLRSTRTGGVGPAPDTDRAPSRVAVPPHSTQKDEPCLA